MRRQDPSARQSTGHRFPATMLGALALALVVVLSGCSPKRAPRSTPQTAGDHRETGIASWYGKPYHGRTTASGERYDMHAMTAAHRTLPFGTMVRVTNLENGRSVRVRITDRGPFTEGRIIDLSYAAAKQLKMVERGVVKVRVEVDS